MKEDIDYILEGLSRPKQANTSKARSIYSLAKMCKQKSSSLGQILRFSGKLAPLLSLLEELLESVCAVTEKTIEDEVIASCVFMISFLRLLELPVPR